MKEKNESQRKQRRIRIRVATFLNLALLVLFMVVSVSIVMIVRGAMYREALANARQQSNIILKRNLATHQYFSEVLKPLLFEEVSQLHPAGYFEPAWMSSTYAIQQIDRYFKQMQNTPDYYYKECAINARSPHNEADDYEKQFIIALNGQPELNEHSEIRTIEGRPFFVTLHRGETMEADCLRCHSVPEAAPADLIRQYGRERSFDRQVGEVISTVSIRIPLAEAYASVRQVTAQLIGAILALLAAAFIVQYFITRRIIIEPLNTLRKKAADITSSEAHLGEQLPVPVGEELQELVQAFNRMSCTLRQDRMDLERKVTDRTTDLQATNHKLTLEIALRQQAEQEREKLIGDLQAINRELEQFTYTVSHDLKSPLVTIKGFTGVLERDLKEGKYDLLGDDLGYIKQASDKMQHLLTDLLDLSRLGRAINSPEAFNLGEEAAQTLKLLTNQIESRSIQVEIHPDLPRVFGDRARIHDVLANLLTNAIKYMGSQEHPRIEIGVTQSEGETVCFVQDNGRGIPPEYQEKIFGLFQRLESDQEGSGVGLAIVKKIVELHRGRVWVESAGAGQGSTFYFTLPVASDTMAPVVSSAS